MSLKEKIQKHRTAIGISLGLGAAAVLGVYLWRRRHGTSAAAPASGSLARMSRKNRVGVPSIGRAEPTPLATTPAQVAEAQATKEVKSKEAETKKAEAAAIEAAVPATPASVDEAKQAAVALEAAAEKHTDAAEAHADKAAAHEALGEHIDAAAEHKKTAEEAQKAAEASDKAAALHDAVAESKVQAAPAEAVVAGGAVDVSTDKADAAEAKSKAAELKTIAADAQAKAAQKHEDAADVAKSVADATPAGPQKDAAAKVVVEQKAEAVKATAEAAKTVAEAADKHSEAAAKSVEAGDTAKAVEQKAEAKSKAAEAQATTTKVIEKAREVAQASSTTSSAEAVSKASEAITVSTAAVQKAVETSSKAVQKAESVPVASAPAATKPSILFHNNRPVDAVTGKPIESEDVIKAAHSQLSGSHTAPPMPKDKESYQFMRQGGDEMLLRSLSPYAPREMPKEVPTGEPFTWLAHSTEISQLHRDFPSDQERVFISASAQPILSSMSTAAPLFPGMEDLQRFNLGKSYFPRGVDGQLIRGADVRPIQSLCAGGYWKRSCAEAPVDVNAAGVANQGTLSYLHKSGY